MSDDVVKPVLKRNVTQVHEEHSLRSRVTQCDHTNRLHRFEALAEGNVEIESVEQDVVDSDADRAEKHFPRTSNTRPCERNSASSCENVRLRPPTKARTSIFLRRSSRWDLPWMHLIQPWRTAGGACLQHGCQSRRVTKRRCH